MDKVFVAQRVANKLYATESAIDAAMVEAAEMMAELVQARKDLRLSAVVGAGVSAKLAKAIAILSDARTTMVEAHVELEETKLRVGIRTKMSGWVKETGLAQDAGAQDVSDLRAVG